MKIKTWLLLSYFIVMVLPLIAIYFLFASVTAFNKERQVDEYLSVYEKIQKMIPILDEPDLYSANGERGFLSELTDEKTTISLYNSDGLLLYHPDGDLFQTVSRDLLFKDLYDLKQELRAFTYKQPVFDDEQFVGVFEIEIRRDELIETIVSRGWVVTFAIIFIFLGIYLTMAYILHLRLNRRVNQLMDEMSAFASGYVATETETGKDEIGELKQHFYTMRKQILAAQEAIELEQRANEYMIATISHDLKTPLTSIKAYAESLDNNGELTEEQKSQYRKVIIEKADFIQKMLDDLTMYSLLQSKNYELELVTVEGVEFFEMLMSGYEPLCEKKGICLTASSEVEGVYEVNPQQLVRVVDNLVMNAIKHTERGRSIWLKAFSKDEALPPWLFPFVKERYKFNFKRNAYVVVQNEGEGIEKHHLQKIFDPLFQVDSARTKKELSGTGLGLSITKQIIEKHGGTITGFSELDVGTCFVCSIPKKEGSRFETA